MKKQNYIAFASIVLCAVFASCTSPESDGKKAAGKYCDCAEEYEKNLNEVSAKFTSKFSSYDFTTRIEARAKLEKLKNNAENDYNKCYQKASEYETKIRNKYATNRESNQKFQYAYATVLAALSFPPIMDESAFENCNKSILSIIPSIPDAEKIKKDFVGRTITKNGDDYRKTRKFQIESLEQIRDIQILTAKEDGDNYTVEIYLELASPISIYEVELIINYNLGTNDDWTIEHIHPKRFETKVTGKYKDCITSTFGNGGFMTKNLAITNHCDVALLVEGVLLTDYEREWLPFEQLVEANSQAFVASWGNVLYTGSVADYKIQKIERP
jgi:hypothetical protein